MTEMYTFSSRGKKVTSALVLVGVLSLMFGIYSIFSAHDDHHHHVMVARLWSNLLINGFFFFSISIAALFFLAVQYSAEVGWFVVVKRVLEAVTSFLPYAVGVMFVVFLAGTLHWHHLYHWMDSEAVAQDSILQHKEAFLNPTFFWFRFLLFTGVYILFQMTIRRWSIAEDSIEGLDLHKKTFNWSAAFLVFFGYTSMVGSWDWIMSIDTHWFSTLFGWYVFSGMWVSAMVVSVILVLYLKSKGLLNVVSSSHIHDMGKWVFATSFLWSYLWFCQFMLIWYSNIPEEVTYYIARFEDYLWLFLGMFFVNFILPMILLMDKDMKRNKGVLAGVGIVILLGHWVDVYLLITPGTMKTEGSIGLFEIGLFLGFLGLFLMVVLRSLSKVPLVVKNNPYLEESLHFHQ